MAINVSIRHNGGFLPDIIRGNDTTGCTQAIFRLGRVKTSFLSTNQLRSFQLDKKEYPVVSQNDLGAPCCVVSPVSFSDTTGYLSKIRVQF